MSKQFWGIILIIILIAIGAVWISDRHKAAAPGSKSAQLTNHVEGKGTTGVKLIEYGDYECPVCGAYFQAVQQTAAKYSSDIFFQFRNFPLTSVHPNAFAGARAAEAANLQDKFWQMHDLLYQNQDPNGASGWVASQDPLNDYFVGFAQQLGLNTSKFKTDYASNTVNNSVNADLNEANKLSLTGTPTFFLDGKQVPLTKLIDPSTNQPSLAQFSKVINAEIAKKSASQKN